MILLRLFIRIPPLLWIALAGYLAWSDYHTWATDVRDAKMATITAKEAQVEAKKAEISRAEDFQKRREEKLAELQNLSQQLESTKSQLPSTSAVPELLRSMANIADTTGISLPKFRPGIELHQQFLVETPIEVTLSGTYVQIMTFLDSLANLARVVTTEKLSFDSAMNKSGVSVLTASVTLITYHLDDTGVGASANPNGH